jgi:hypothetical protein
VHLSAADADRIDLSLFNEEDPLQHMMKLIFGFGIYCMLRGNEHASLLVSQVVFGNYPRTFEYPALAGHPYVALDNLIDKTCKVIIHNNYAQRTSEFLRIPINETDPACLGASVKRYMKKLAPGQVRLYCHIATPEYIQSNYRRHGNTTSIFYPNLPIGVNKIKELMAAKAKILRLPESFRPHSLRAVGVTKLANPVVAESKSKGVNESEEHIEYVDVSAAVTQAELQHDGNVSDGSGCTLSTELELNIHKKKLKSSGTAVQDATCDSTQVELQKLKEEFSSLKGVVIKEEEKEKKKAAPEPMSLTQAGIIDLTEEIGELHRLVKKCDSPKRPSPMSANQLAIHDLKQQVKS